MTNGQAFGLFFIFLGILIIVIRATRTHQTLKLHRIGVTTTATVTSVTSHSGEGGTFHRTGLTFTLEDGKDTHVTVTMGVPYFEGKKLTVIYDPNKPSRLDAYSEISGGAFALGRLWRPIAALVLTGPFLVIYPLVA